MATMLYILAIQFLCLIAWSLSMSVSRTKRSTYQNSDCATEIRRNGMTLLNEGIRAFDSSIQISGSFFEALDKLYKHTDRDVIFNVTRAGLKKINRHAVGHFENASIPILEVKFIYVYTTKSVYKVLNKSLREHNCSQKTLNDEERNIAPFSAMLMAVLMYWSELEKESGIVYRKINISEQDVSLYQNEVSFAWTQYISTTRDRSKSFDGNTEFIINNRNNRGSILSPRRVRNHAWDYSLDEVVFCPGAEYKVTKVNEPHNGIITVELDYIPWGSSGSETFRQNVLMSVITTMCFSLL